MDNCKKCRELSENKMTDEQGVELIYVVFPLIGVVALGLAFIIQEEIRMIEIIIDDIAYINQYVVWGIAIFSMLSMFILGYLFGKGFIKGE